MNKVIELQSFNYVPIQQSLSRDIVLNKMVGTHFFGSFKGLSFTQITELFGTPITSEEDHVKYQWLIEFEDQYRKYIQKRTLKNKEY